MTVNTILIQLAINTKVFGKGEASSHGILDSYVGLVGFNFQHALFAKICNHATSSIAVADV
jgi:hypothetical protein